MYAYTHTHANTRKHTHTHTNTTHTHTHTHTHIDIRTNQLSHTHTHTRTCVHAPTQTRTQCSFTIGGPSLWNHLPDNVGRMDPSSCLSRYLKRSYLVNLSKYRLFLNFVTVPSTLFDLCVVKNDVKCPTSSHNTPVSTCTQSVECCEK